MSSKKEKVCFILMPFKEELKDVYNKAMKPACKEVGFEPRRVDEKAGPFCITKEIIEKIDLSDVIIADMTDKNANVFYEMGVAHAFGNKTILIIQEPQEPPFDMKDYHAIKYIQNESGLKKLKNDLIKSLQGFKKWRMGITNPVQHFKPSHVSNQKQISSIIRKKDKRISEMEKEIYALKSLLDSTSAAYAKPLRNKPQIEIAVEKAKKMITKKKFFHSAWNLAGRGVYHSYQMIEHHGHDLVIDHATRLTWQKSGSTDKMNYEQAERFIHRLNIICFGEHNDWRLPTLEEAMSLMERDMKNSDLYIDQQFDKLQDMIWTSDRVNESDAWYINYNQGWCDSQSTRNIYFVRAVRSGI